MQTATVTELEKRLSYFLDEVSSSHDPLYVVGDKNRVVIINSLTFFWFPPCRQSIRHSYRIYTMTIMLNNHPILKRFG